MNFLKANYLISLLEMSRKELNKDYDFSEFSFTDFEMINSYLIDKALNDKNFSLLISNPEKELKTNYYVPVILSAAVTLFYQNYVDDCTVYQVGDIVQDSRNGSRYGIKEKREGKYFLSYYYPDGSEGIRETNEELIKNYIITTADLTKRKTKTKFEAYRKIFDKIFKVGNYLPSQFIYKSVIIVEKKDFFNAVKDSHICELNFHKSLPFTYVTKTGNESSNLPIESMIYLVPDYDTFYNYVLPKKERIDTVIFISATYFPKWMYCNNCERFNHIKNWWEGWKKTLSKYKIKEKFIPPKCYHCYDEAKKKTSKDCKRRRFYYELEQIRFIMISPSGEASDLPWDRWPTAVKNIKEENSDMGTIRIDFENDCCNNQDLRYFKSTKFADLAGIRIECNNCGRNNTLSGLFGLRLSVYGKENIFSKPVIRTSNSVYYPILINSIYLPTHKEIDNEDQQAIKEWLSEGEDIEFIFKALRRKYMKEKLEQFIKSEVENEFEPEDEYRLKEYKFIVDPENMEFKDENNNLCFERQDIGDLSNFGFDNLTIVKRLKITTVQTAFTRQEPLDKDQILSGAIMEVKVEPKYTSKWGNQTEYLPAVESFGEGIFLSLNSEDIDKWIYNSFKTLDEFQERINTTQGNVQSSESITKGRFDDEEYLAKFILIHTLSHLLIKELEFLCGYPAASLNERLFVDKNDMQGILIYTVAGAEGSYGGLISQGNLKHFKRILQSALFRAQDCSSDPVCYNTTDGQGVGGLNMAACYSCTLLPETTCEEFNCFLDRALLVDNRFGFFSEK